MPRQEKERGENGVLRDPGDEETMRLYYNAYDNKLKVREIGLRFVEAIRQIRCSARQHDIYPAEALLMISYSLGYNDWLDIPWGAMGKCVDLMVSYGGDKKYKLFDPEFYVKLVAERGKIKLLCEYRRIDEVFAVKERVSDMFSKVPNKSVKFEQEVKHETDDIPMPF